MSDQDFDAEYLSVRRYLRRCELVHVLALAYHFTQHHQFQASLNRRFCPAPSDEGFAIDRFDYLFDTLAREAILNCPRYGVREPSDLAGVRGLLAELHKYEDRRWGQGRQDGDILYEIVRKAHRQFPWQARAASDDWIRAFKLYNHPALRPLVESRFGMSVPELYQIGMGVFGHFLGTPFGTLQWDNFVNQVSQERVDAFFERFSCSLETARALAHERATHDINWAYNLSPLADFPILRIDEEKSMMCPIPTLLSWRLTGGLYFEIVSSSDTFRHAYGAAFEAYVGEVLEAANATGSYRVLPPEFYGGRSRRNHSVDWIAEDETGALFIEAKAPRLKLERKIDLRSRQNIDAGLELMGAFVCQTYKTLSHALAGRYPHWKPGPKPIFPVIVTLDDWNSIGPIASKIDGWAKRGLEAEGIDSGLLDQFPYTVFPVQVFEDAIQIMANVGIERFMTLKTQPTHQQSLCAGFVFDEFRDERRKFVVDLFPNAWKEIDPRL